MEKRRHQKRLDMIYPSQARFFVTICTHRRRGILAYSDRHDILYRHWSKCLPLHGWAIGSYVVMPDHVHFFCTDAQSRVSLSDMVGSFKQWSAKAICQRTDLKAPLWQREFFDHLIRSAESYSGKWEYVRQNPVRAGLVERAEDWKYSGQVDYA